MKKYVLIDGMDLGGMLEVHDAINESVERFNARAYNNNKRLSASSGSKLNLDKLVLDDLCLLKMSLREKDWIMPHFYEDVRHDAMVEAIKYDKCMVAVFDCPDDMQDAFDAWMIPSTFKTVHLQDAKNTLNYDLDILKASVEADLEIPHNIEVLNCGSELDGAPYNAVKFTLNGKNYDYNIHFQNLALDTERIHKLLPSRVESLYKKSVNSGKVNLEEYEEHNKQNDVKDIEHYNCSCY